MAKCNSCSAPLPANINLCTYCNVRNDVDLHGKHAFSVTTKHSERICPQCDTSMQTVKLDIDEALYIERCNSCYGLFFDPGEIEALLASSVSNIFDINLNLIKSINKDRYNKKKFKYVKCPVCRVLMNRVSFGQRSGVIIDQCKKHGVWLENGEITHLMEWKKAGGQLLHAQKKEKPKEKINTRKQRPVSPDHDDIFSHRQQQTYSMENDLLESVSSLIYRLFK